MTTNNVNTENLKQLAETINQLTQEHYKRDFISQLSKALEENHMEIIKKEV